MPVTSSRVRLMGRRFGAAQWRAQHGIGATRSAASMARTHPLSRAEPPSKPRKPERV